MKAVRRRAGAPCLPLARSSPWAHSAILPPGEQTSGSHPLGSPLHAFSLRLRRDAPALPGLWAAFARPDTTAPSSQVNLCRCLSLILLRREEERSSFAGRRNCPQTRRTRAEAPESTPGFGLAALAPFRLLAARLPPALPKSGQGAGPRPRCQLTQPGLRLCHLLGAERWDPQLLRPTGTALASTACPGALWRAGSRPAGGGCCELRHD